jgi:hypothetical protein
LGTFGSETGIKGPKTANFLIVLAAFSISSELKFNAEPRLIGLFKKALNLSWLGSKQIYFQEQQVTDCV